MCYIFQICASYLLSAKIRAFIQQSVCSQSSHSMVTVPFVSARLCCSVLCRIQNVSTSYSYKFLVCVSAEGFTWFSLRLWGVVATYLSTERGPNRGLNEG